MAERITLVIGHNGEKPKVLYCGTSGAESDAAYNDAKGYDTVEFYRYPVADKRRDGAGRSQGSSSPSRDHMPPTLPTTRRRPDRAVRKQLGRLSPGRRPTEDRV